MIKYLIATVMLATSMLATAQVKPVAIGYTPGELVPVKVVCKEQNHMANFIVGDPTLLSREAQMAIMANCVILPVPVWIVLLDCVEGPLYDPTMKADLSVCRVEKGEVIYHIQLPYTHPNLKDV